MHMEVAHDLQVGIDHFLKMWDNLEVYDLEYDYLIPRYSHASYREMGIKILRDWYALYCWDTDIVLAREYEFLVPLGEHQLQGTVDRLSIRQTKSGEPIVLASDYKTSSKAPTRDYLAHDLQFTAYAYASTQPEFWTHIPNGEEIYAKYLDAERHGEWVHLRTVKRIEAGRREQYHYNRLQYAVNQIADAIALGIYVPTISGEKCEYCEFRKICGLPSRVEEGLDPA